MLTKKMNDSAVALRRIAIGYQESRHCIVCSIIKAVGYCLPILQFDDALGLLIGPKGFLNTKLYDGCALFCRKTHKATPSFITFLKKGVKLFAFHSSVVYIIGLIISLICQPNSRIGYEISSMSAAVIRSLSSRMSTSQSLSWLASPRAREPNNIARPFRGDASRNIRSIPSATICRSLVFLSSCKVDSLIVLAMITRY